MKWCVLLSTQSSQYVQCVAGCLQLMLRVNEYRFAWVEADGVNWWAFFFFFKLYLDILDLTIAFFPMTSFRIEFSCKRQLLCWSTRRICFKKFIQPDKENCRCGYQREALMLLYSSWSIHKYLKGNRPAVCLQLKMLWLFFFFTCYNKNWRNFC